MKPQFPKDADAKPRPSERVKEVSGLVYDNGYRIDAEANADIIIRVRNGQVKSLEVRPATGR